MAARPPLPPPILNPAAVEQRLDSDLRRMWGTLRQKIATGIVTPPATSFVTVQLALGGVPATALPPQIVHFGYRVTFWTIACAGTGHVEVEPYYAPLDRYDGSISSMIFMPGPGGFLPQTTDLDGTPSSNSAIGVPAGTLSDWTIRDIPADGFIRFEVVEATVPFTIALKLERAT